MYRKCLNDHSLYPEFSYNYQYCVAGCEPYTLCGEVVIPENHLQVICFICNLSSLYVYNLSLCRSVVYAKAMAKTAKLCLLSFRNEALLMQILSFTFPQCKLTDAAKETLLPMLLTVNKKLLLIGEFLA